MSVEQSCFPLHFNVLLLPFAYRHVGNWLLWLYVFRFLPGAAVVTPPIVSDFLQQNAEGVVSLPTESVVLE